MTIQSNSSTASLYATQISSSGSNVSGTTTVSKDIKTTLSGNANAHSEIDLSHAAGPQFASALSTFVSHIHSTASEFEALDNQMSQQLSTTTPVVSLPTSSSTSSNTNTNKTFTPNASLFGRSY